MTDHPQLYAGRAKEESDSCYAGWLARIIIWIESIGSVVSETASTASQHRSDSSIKPSWATRDIPTGPPVRGLPTSRLGAPSKLELEM